MNNKDITIPRFHYRDVHNEAVAILETARTAGSVKAAMVDYLLKRKDSLPEGLTAEAAVGKILESVDGFAAAHEDGKTRKDIAEAIREAIAEMDGRQALAYLAVLEETFRVCDIKAANDGNAFDAEAFGRSVKEIVDNASESEVQARIDTLAAEIEGDSLLAYTFAGGNEDLAAIAKSGFADGVSEEDAEALREVVEGRVAKAELYAATACACYGSILDGKVEGVDPQTVDAGVMTALVVAGLEKASILRRLLRGEIDEEMARSLLETLSRTLKWILVKALQFCVGVLAMEGVILALTGITWIASSSLFLLVAGVTAGFVMMCAVEEDCEGIVDFLGALTAVAVKTVWSALKWAWNAAGNALSSVAENRPSEERSSERNAAPALAPAN
ncbi:MAG: hypothetical protein IKH04_08620 [Kiritimatiellae bacterium]|nr:hypothetical protein [Kiritimatiellia bacterium]